MRDQLTRDRLLLLVEELSRAAPRRGTTNLYVLGGGTAVYLGWRASTIDADLYADREAVFRNIQEIKDRLNVNVELARPEDFVPPLRGSASRHVFIARVGSVAFHHYDPYAQLFSKVVRGFERDLQDAREFIRSGLVEAGKFRSLVAAIPDSAYARYPNLSRAGVERAVEAFLSGLA